MAGRGWLADPANAERRTALVAQLRGWGEKAGGAAGGLAGQLAKQVERHRPTLASWERGLMDLRAQMADRAGGEERGDAIEAYITQAEAGVRFVERSGTPEATLREVLGTLAAEERMLRGERLRTDERERALVGIARARAAGRRAASGGRRA